MITQVPLLIFKSAWTIFKKVLLHDLQIVIDYSGLFLSFMIFSIYIHLTIFNIVIKVEKLKFDTKC